MNMLHRTCTRQFQRFFETFTQTSTPLKLVAERLNKRALVRVHGQEAVPFLQGLTTNDMRYLDGNPSMFTMFLNNSGKVLYDAIIYKTPSEDTFIIECDRDLSNELRRHLRMYRVRRKIDIDDMNSEYAAWVVYNPVEDGEQLTVSESGMKEKPEDVIFTVDPRVKELGVRTIQPHGNNVKDIASLFSNVVIEELPTSDYTSHRYNYGVGEGASDHPPGKCFPLEANCDFLHGVSFHKGCYVGQELTARVYHTGVVRKRLMPLKLTSDLDPNVTNVQTTAGAVVGTIRGTSHRRAIALLRIEKVLHAQELMVDGEPCHTYKPHWWSSELPKRQALQSD